MPYTSLSDYDYPFDPSLVAQQPCEPRDQARLMVVDRQAGTIQHSRFDALPDILCPRDQLVLNNTRVLPARLLGRRATGGKIEILLSRRRHDGCWSCLAKPAKKMRIGQRVTFSPEFYADVVAEGEGGVRVIRFGGALSEDEGIQRHGLTPLPPYIDRSSGVRDEQDYQTVYASDPGAVAAPTAGLHFTEQLLKKLVSRQVEPIEVTLHVGSGTFLPVQSENIVEHRMHTEFAEVSDRAAVRLNALDRGRRVCVGTTSLRTLESSADEAGVIHAGQYETDLFIYPGYRFKALDLLLTNFHLPRTTLLMLVCAVGGYDLMMEAYHQAVRERYRLFSYGDAMLIL